MPFPKPIRYDVDTWLCMRTDPVLPKAGIQRLRDRSGGEKYLLIKWDTDPKQRALMGVYDSLEKANSLVNYDPPDTSKTAIPPSMMPPGHPDRVAAGYRDDA